MMNGLRKNLEAQDNGRRLKEINYSEMSFELNLENMGMIIVKLCLLISLPVFSYYYLKKNKDNLTRDDFKKPYGTLYMGLKENRDSVYMLNSLFCGRRFVLALSTIYFNSFLVANIYVTLFGSLIMIKFFYDYKPYESPLLNRFEKVNEIFTLFINYGLFIFTEFVPDVEVRYKMGFYYINLVSLVFAFNISLIAFDII
jgi:hypothetical protein